MERTSYKSLVQQWALEWHPVLLFTLWADFGAKYIYTYPVTPLLFLWYIDDIFIIWQHGWETVHSFIQHLNTCSPNLKFTFEVSRDKLSFLHTWVKLEDNLPITELFSKPTDSHNYLVYNSAHPQQCIDSIPYSQFLRMMRI